MLKGLKWKLIIYVAITLLAILLVLPTVTSQLPSWYTRVIPTDKISQGLDLQGGMHLILEAEADKAVESYVEGIKNNLKDDLKDRGIPAGKVEREKRDQIVLEVSGEKGKWEKPLSERYSIMQELSNSEIGGGIWRIVLVLDSKQADRIKKSALDQALETIRNRVDQFGVSEPEITLVKDKDRLSVYPIFESFDISGITKVRDKPLRLQKDAKRLP